MTSKLDGNEEDTIWKHFSNADEAVDYLINKELPKQLLLCRICNKHNVSKANEMCSFCCRRLSPFFDEHESLKKLGLKLIKYDMTKPSSLSTFRGNG
jgi:hypothetical protein